MKSLYAALAVAGYIAPNWLVLLVSIDTGNVLLWTRPMETMAGMFANRIAAAFAIDVLSPLWLPASGFIPRAAGWVCAGSGATGC